MSLQDMATLDRSPVLCYNSLMLNKVDYANT
jgi:hypothetical protein